MTDMNEPTEAIESNGTHRCPGPECSRRVPSNMLACSRHWFQVPREVRDEVWAAWRSLQRGAATPEELEAKNERHGRAMAAAIPTMRPLHRA